ncbi:tannase/feruloyl esterase family alpha/beta hydrolase [Steroidobacter sp.]|uniref:tannase/feruloyl esterase family alpha/beta hydrolase n=1 Tax=Steroidobacter sp. TaxID=1978227 RepID=UPI001A4B275B|nr:tannase/feruloyl esterase family alpha/beta hydrolase [Steroidobacter sp.]MBL8269407.1 tannase/feruloyl esterase family alpha/beta hydrolase [Steroidobacter sp.]
MNAVRVIAHSLLLVASLAVGSGVYAAGAAPLDAPLTASMQCERLVDEDFKNSVDAPLSVLSAKLIAAKDGTGEYCAVNGYIQPQIQFEVRLPSKNWNGRYFQVGCGGFCGVININNCADALAANFVVAAHNMGHVGLVVKDPIWGSDPSLREDYAGRSTHLMSVAGKELAARYYGKRPARSYFRGCSTGGREGLTEAQHYPEDFDGIIAGDPAFPGRLGAIANNWDAQKLLRDDGSEVFTPAKLAVLNAGVMKSCDKLDGLVDGILTDPRTCKFDPAKLQCKQGDGPDCLTAEQVSAAKALYSGPVNSKGEKLMPGATPYGSELSWSGAGRRSLAEGYLRYLAFPTNPPADYNYRTFNFDTDVAKTEQMAALYDPVAPFESPDLRAFEQRGGKLLVYHGWADAGVSPMAMLDYYAQVTSRQGGGEKVREWFRVFMVPGMFHCRGGNAPNTFELLPELVKWVEQGVAPDRVVATQSGAQGLIRTRPLFPYPSYAKYTGKGDVNDAANWVQASPKKEPDDRLDWLRAPK